MNAADCFIDTNILLYLLSKDEAKANRAEELIAAGGVVSVQVLNEFAAVARRKAGLSWAEIRACLLPLRQLFHVESLRDETHVRALGIAERNQVHIYDAAIIASALQAGCRLLYTEDLHRGQLFERRLVVRNPFRDD